MASESILELLGSSDAEVRRQGIRRVSTETGPNALALLMKGLEDEDWRVRKEAVKAFGLKASDAAAVDRLVSVLLPGENVGLRNAAVEALGYCGVLAVDALERVLPQLDADGRKLAAEALAQTARVQALPVLGSLLEDEDINVRAAAIEAIAGVGAESQLAADLLERALEQDHSFIQLVTLDSIGRLGLTPSWERLKPLLGDPLLRPSALQLATRTGDPNAASAYVEELGKASKKGWWRAVENMAMYAECTEQSYQATRQALSQLPVAIVDRLLADCAEPEGDDRGSHRQNALSLLAIAGEGRLGPIAVALLEDEQLGVVAYQALERLGVAALDYLIECANTSTSARVASCIELLTRLADEPSVRDRVIQALRRFDQNWPAHAKRAWLLAVQSLEDQAALNLALPLVAEESSVAVRNSALAAARTFATSFPESAKERAKQLAPDASDAALFGAFYEVLGSPLLQSTGDDLNFLMAAASNASVSARVAALRALGEFPSDEGVEVVAFAFHDEVAEVRMAALSAMSRMRDANGKPVGTARIIHLLHSEEGSPLTVAAIRALGRGGDRSALPELQKLAAKDDARWAVPAVEALSAFDDKAVAPTLQVALHHAEPEVVKAAMNVLAASSSFDDGSTHRGLIRCLSHRAWDVRRLAADLLGRIASEEAHRALRERLSIEKETPVIDAIRRSLGSVGSSSGSISIAPLPREER